MAYSFKAIVLTTVFGLGKTVATVGSNLFGLDSALKDIGIRPGSKLGQSIKYSGVVSGGIITALTRIPAMWNQFTTPSASILSYPDNPAHNKARTISVYSGSIGCTAAILAGLSAYLGGFTLADTIHIPSGVSQEIFSYYTFSSTVVSFLVYSVVKVINSSYEFGLWLFSNHSWLDLLSKTNLLTAFATLFCTLSSISMFYFSIKHSLPLFLNKAFNLKVNDTQTLMKTIAGISIYPSESTYIFSQVASVKKYFESEQSIYRNHNRSLRNDILLASIILLSLSAITNQLLGYYVFMREMTTDMGIDNRFVIETLSVLSSLSAAFVFYAFNVRPAIEQSITIINKLPVVTCSSNRFRFWNEDHTSQESASLLHGPQINAVEETGQVPEVISSPSF